MQVCDMAESSATADSDVILPYRFEPEGLWSSSEESDSDDSENQLSFTERLGNTSWCSCANCVTLPRAIECTCCQELPEVEERLEDSDACVASLEVFKTVCLDKDVLYTALVTMHTVRGDEVETPISNRLKAIAIVCISGDTKSVCRSYRLAAYRQFTNWMYNFLGKGNRRVVPACVVNAIRLKFPEPDNVYVGFKAAELK